MKKNHSSFKYIFLIGSLILSVLYFLKSEGFISPITISKNGFIDSIGTITSLVGIILAVVIYYFSERAQAEIKRLSNEVHSLSILTYKNQSLQLLLDNLLKSSKESKERSYWHYRFSFENYDTLILKVQNEDIKIKIKGTNIAPFQSPAENIITYMYVVDVVDSKNNRIPMGKAYCSFIDGKNKIALDCNQLDLIEPIYDFDIIGPDVLHSSWISDKPKFYDRLKNIKQYHST